ncbi:hypothetical protein ACFSTE_12305 [Aquimarina hainanensis]|uniref:XRE family transcriptional regulator n=1 Tax=Aquimarina hainanensis TaxID=1578017 RepID=A0ABW5N8S6_9FLAO|nr:hypothetical protein [Aquimarina sp. TRL1]QKX03795.1 hypothetical protein HN014_02290 [Aquimarina sp. TRL1]
MDKPNKILDRVIAFAEFRRVSLRSFSLSIGASAGYLHRLQSVNSNIGGDFIEKIINLYTELNPVWLVTGKGKMLKPGAKLAEEPDVLYGQRDFLKEALLHYLDDEDVRSKIISIVQEGMDEEE